MQYPVNNQTATMSSREIAEVTGKQHQHVKRDIEKMLVDLQEDVSNFGRIYQDSMNRQQTEYVLDREHTECLIAGYSAVLRMKVIRRLRELEEGGAFLKRCPKRYALPLTWLNSWQSQRQKLPLLITTLKHLAQWASVRQRSC